MILFPDVTAIVTLVCVIVSHSFFFLFKVKFTEVGRKHRQLYISKISYRTEIEQRNKIDAFQKSI